MRQLVPRKSRALVPAACLAQRESSPGKSCNNREGKTKPKYWVRFLSEVEDGGPGGGNNRQHRGGLGAGGDGGEGGNGNQGVPTLVIKFEVILWSISHVFTCRLLFYEQFSTMNSMSRILCFHSNVGSLPPGKNYFVIFPKVKYF